MSYWDEEDFTPYEDGGFTGQRPQVEQPTVEQPDPGASAAPAAPAPKPFDPSGQVGHDGTFNGMTREQYRDAWMSSGVNSVQGMKDWIAKNGGTWLADNGTVRTPFGEVLDMGGNARGSSAGNGVLRPTWGGGGGPAPSSGEVGTGVPLGAIGAGYGYSAGAAPAMSVGQSGHLGGSFSPFVYEDFKAPEAFKAPTIEDAQNDPGYAFAQQQGQRAITNMASKHGNLLSGEFAKGMADYNQGLATTHYGDVYNRAASAYDRNYGNAFGANQANNAGRLGAFTANTNADLGYGNLGVAQQNANTGAQSVANQYSLGMANVGLGYHTADQSYDLGLRNNALGYTEAGNNYSLGLGNQNLGWANYGLNAQGQNFNQQYSLANLGLNAVGQAGQYGSSYGNNAGGYAIGRGNATAAGQAGAGAAWGGMLSGLGNLGLGYGIYGATSRPGGA